jgi:dimeric dUTPase (all-alpha-NTP-PPase superfamily)
MLADQKKLDEEIFKNSGIKEYPLENIKLALLVELGELCNEDKSFKYWKKHKEVNKERLLDEFADCLHFSLSLENHLGQIRRDKLIDFDNFVNPLIENSKKMEDDISEDFINTFCAVLEERSILIAVIVLGICLDIPLDEMESCYYKKHKENYKRQQEGY